MPLQPPLLDTRTLADIMSALRGQAQTDLPGWTQSPSGDPGVMLQRIFARLIEIALQRLNRAPEKNLLALLDAMGISLLTPSPAQSPVTFSLLKGAPPTFIARGAQVGTKSTPQTQATTFETMRDFTVVPTQILRAFTVDPIWDRFTDLTAAVAGQSGAAFTPFVGVEPIPHVLYVGDDVLLNCGVPAVATLRILSSGDSRIWGALIYQYLTAGVLVEAGVASQSNATDSDVLQVTIDLELIQPIDRTSVGGVGLPPTAQSRWLRAILPAPITDFIAASSVRASAVTLSVRSKSPFAPDMAFSDQAPLDMTKEFLPFGPAPSVGTCFYLASQEAFSRPNSTVTLNMNVVATDPPGLIWEYFDGNSWAQLPTTSVQDDTNSFVRSGTISIVAPAGSSTSRRTTVSIRGRLLSGTYLGFPAITAFELRDTAKLAANIAGQAPSGSPTTTVIQVDASALGDPPPSFGAYGQVLNVDGEYAVVMGNAGDGKGLIIAPPPAGAHSAGSAVKLMLTTEAVQLSSAANAGSLMMNVTSRNQLGANSLLLVDDPPAVEFVTVRSIGANGANQLNLVAPLRFSHQQGTSVSVVGPMHVYGLANDRWVDTDNIKKSDPFVPFGIRPGPGNFFVFYADFPIVVSRISLGETLVPSAEPGEPQIAGGFALASLSHAAIAIPAKVLGNIGVLTNPFFFAPQFQIIFNIVVDGNPPPIDIAWEYLSAAGWTTIPEASVADNTKSFLAEGPNAITIKLGAPIAGQVNGQQDHWIRARIASGNYGVPLVYMPVDPAQPALGFAIRPGSGNLHPPVLTNLTLDYRTDNADPEKLLTQNGFLYSDQTSASAPFAPFVAVTDLVPAAQADPEPAFYLGFDLAFPQQPVTLYFDATARAFSGRVVREVSLAPSLVDQLPVLRWEYFNGVVWTGLPVVDGSHNLIESGELEFETPLDIAPLARFDTVDRYWIRARSATNDPLSTQELDGIFLNTTTVVQQVTVAGDVLGSSNGQPGQSFRFSRPPVLPGQQVMVHEPEPPSDVEEAQLHGEEGADAVGRIVNPITNQVEVWVRWHEVNNFLASDPYSRHYTLDHTGGTLTFGAMIPPPGANNITANYRCGGGMPGNLPRGAISQLKSTLPGVASAVNPTSSDGGADPETVTMVEDRGPQALKHRGRAVAAADIEWLAREAAGSRVARAKCIPNVNQELAFEPGWTTLLIVPNGTESKLSPDSQLISEVESYLTERAFAGLAQQTPVRINVIGAGYIRVTVAAKVAAVNLDDAMLVQQRVLTALATYFHPITGGKSGTGWEFGQAVYASKVSELIENMPGVDHIAALQLIPNLAHHLLTFDGASSAPSYLTQATQVLSVDRSKAALLAQGADVDAGRALIRGFKEGDRIARVIDVTVNSIGPSAVGVAYTANSAGVPRGSVVITFDGQQRTRLTAGILPNQTVTSLSLETSLVLRPGDIITLVHPFPMTIVSVTLETIELTVRDVQGVAITVAPFSVDVSLPSGTAVTTVDGIARSRLDQRIGAGQSGLTTIVVADVGFATSLTPGEAILLHAPSQRLDVESYEATLAFGAGAVMATLDNSVRLPLLDSVPAGQQFSTIRLSDFAAGDQLAPAVGTGAKLTVQSVDPVYDQIAIDDNFLVYSGPHQIAMVEH